MSGREKKSKAETKRGTEKENKRGRRTDKRGKEEEREAFESRLETKKKQRERDVAGEHGQMETTRPSTP